MWSKLGIRVTSALIGVVPVLCLIFAPAWVFNLGIAIVAFVSLYELNKTFNQENKWQLVVLDYMAAGAILICAIRFSGDSRALSFILVLYAMLVLICATIFNKSIKFSNVSSSVFMLIYAVLFISHLIFIRQAENGKALIFIPLIGAWMPDTFAYFSGMLFGKHKLIPAISPKKTVEGSIGAVFGSVAMFLLYGFILTKLGFTVNFMPLVILALLCGVVAQFGDLAASLMKRECGVKDFGNLIPGHGGILDRIDSLIFIAPLVYYFMLIAPVIS